MKALIVALALAVPATAIAQATPARAEMSYHARLYERYCDKLRDSATAYVQFVRAKKTIYGYTYSDFAPVNPGDAVRYDCKVPAERVAAVHRELRVASR